jgi:deazaflavin-dependent oxidoreductase (nitroreductase family)
MAATPRTSGPAEAEISRGPVIGPEDRARAPRPAKRRTRPLFGLRVHPGRLALAVFRLPLPLYRRGWGSLLGHTFLLLVHAGRKSGTIYSSVAMALTYDPATQEAVICSVRGERADWVRNIRVRPALQVRIGPESFTPQQRFLTKDERFDVAVEFRRRPSMATTAAHAHLRLGRSTLRRRRKSLRPQSPLRGSPAGGLHAALTASQSCSSGGNRHFCSPRMNRRRPSWLRRPPPDGTSEAA